MDVLNAEQLAYWDGDAGTTWVRNQTHLDQLLSPFYASSDWSARVTWLAKRSWILLRLRRNRITTR